MQPHKHRLLHAGVPRPGVCVLLMALAWPSLGVAHELEDEAVPNMPGWRLSAGVALSAIHANQAWPTPRHAGVLLTGEQARDRSGELGLEHAVLGFGLRANRHWSAQWALGQHDRDAPHVEVARVQGEWTVGWWQPGEQLRWRLGRQTVPLGAVIGQAGQLDPFAQAPLAKQTVLNTTWVDGSSSLQWQAAPNDAEGPRLSQVELGVWRARKFPAGPHGAAAPSLRLQGQWGHWRADVGAVWLQPEGRGAAVQGVGGVGHSHGVPDCRVSMAQRICFDGQAQLLAASLATDSDDGRWTLQAAGLWRRERGISARSMAAPPMRATPAACGCKASGAGGPLGRLPRVWSICKHARTCTAPAPACWPPKPASRAHSRSAAPPCRWATAAGRRCSCGWRRAKNAPPPRSPMPPCACCGRAHACWKEAGDGHSAAASPPSSHRCWPGPAGLWPERGPRQPAR
ncbi:hypothetical protein [Ideonella paludis]|uniref:hypothetical protein n=1 Tax=Ideonella paludis TaxID=1233411 RepID=UPI00363359AB